MPRLKLTLPPPAVPWTKVPNKVFDQLLPSLKDTELRILLLLIRQTTGWKRDRKSVVMTYELLKQRSGRGSEAISLALSSLRKRGLIHSEISFTQNPARSGTERPQEKQDGNNIQKDR